MLKICQNCVLFYVTLGNLLKIVQLLKSLLCPSYANTYYRYFSNFIYSILKVCALRNHLSCISTKKIINYQLFMKLLRSSQLQECSTYKFSNELVQCCGVIKPDLTFILYPDSFFVQLVCFYYVLTTFTTVGYGI